MALASIVGMLLSSASADAATLYVDVDAAQCDDSQARSENSSESPWCSIQPAAEQAEPGDVVEVAAGTYESGDAQFGVAVKVSGEEGAPITFRAQERWAAHIKGPTPSTQDGDTYCWNIATGRSHIRIEGFEISGCSNGININNDNHHIEVVRNHIHDIGRRVTDSRYGQNGISFGGGSTHLLADGNYIHTIGRLEGSSHPHNHDHGIYIRNTDVNVINNVFADHRAGWAIHIYNNSTWKERLRIVNNTFLDPNPNRQGHIIIADRTRDVLIANNIFRDPLSAAIRNNECEERAEITVRDNLTDVGAMIYGETCDIVLEANQLEADPMLVEQSSGVWRPQPGSPAIDGADASIAPDHDFLGGARPQGDGVDLGALEVVAEPGAGDRDRDVGGVVLDAGNDSGHQQSNDGGPTDDASEDVNGDDSGRQTSGTGTYRGESCSASPHRSVPHGSMLLGMLTLLAGAVLSRRTRT